MKKIQVLEEYRFYDWWDEARVREFRKHSYIGEWKKFLVWATAQISSNVVVTWPKEKRGKNFGKEVSIYGSAKKNHDRVFFIKLFFLLIWFELWVRQLKSKKKKNDKTEKIQSLTIHPVSSSGREMNYHYNTIVICCRRSRTWQSRDDG